MAKRGRKKKFKIAFNISPETVRSVVAITLILVSGLMFVSFLFPSYFLNKKVHQFLINSFGHMSVLLPVITAIAGLLFVDSIKNKIKESRVFTGLVLFLVASVGLLGMVKEEYGGVVGTLLAETLSSAISKYGAIFVFSCLILLSVVLVFNISLDYILEILMKYRNIIKTKLFHGETSKDKKENIVITSNMPSENLTESLKNIPHQFEVIPSMSEPQKNVVMPEKDDSYVNSVISDLPYANKIWKLPPYNLLDEITVAPPDTGNVQANAKIIKDTLKSFNIDIEIVDIQVGPSVTKYALDTPAGIKVSKIANLQYDLALALASPTGSVRIEAPIPGKALVGIEVPNKTRSLVKFKSLITSDAMKGDKSKLVTALGKDVGGKTHIYDISKMPHLLIAGATGSGKSVFIHNLIFSILFRASPQEVKFIMVDPKRVELAPYRDLPHLYTPLVTDIEKAPAVFKWAVSEMNRRYKLFESARARNIESYNEMSGFQALPYIVIVVDELSEIMVADPASVEKSIIRLAQLARATGIHLVLAVQRPSADVITGLIKANIPCRIAFNVTGQVDSRVIIDQSGAEKLLGKGDMLFVPPDKPTPVRLQGAFITDKEISSLMSFLKGQGVAPEYKKEIFEIGEKGSKRGGKDMSKDVLYDEAVDVVISADKASASLLQRRLSIGYARAARMLDNLEENGVVGPAKGSRPRDVLRNTDYLSTDEDNPMSEVHSPSIESLSRI